MHNLFFFNILIYLFAKTLLARPSTNVLLKKKKASTPLKRQRKWLSEDDVIGNVKVNWGNTYRLPFLCTTKTKLRVFQFKFLHRRIAKLLSSKDRPKRVGLLFFFFGGGGGGDCTETLIRLCFGTANIPRLSGKALLSGFPKILP